MTFNSHTKILENETIRNEPEKSKNKTQQAKIVLDSKEIVLFQFLLDVAVTDPHYIRSVFNFDPFKSHAILFSKVDEKRPSGSNNEFKLI